MRTGLNAESMLFILFLELGSVTVLHERGCGLFADGESRKYIFKSNRNHPQES